MVKSRHHDDLTTPSRPRQLCLYFLPLPQRHGSLRPGSIDESLTGSATTLSNADLTESPSSRRLRL
jgi:hypothetical protein